MEDAMQTLKFVKFNCEHALGKFFKMKLKVYFLMCIERNDKGGKLIILLCFLEIRLIFFAYSCFCETHF
jgi:hypothetical protein